MVLLEPFRAISAAPMSGWLCARTVLCDSILCHPMTIEQASMSSSICFEGTGACIAAAVAGGAASGAEAAHAGREYPLQPRISWSSPSLDE